MKKDMSDFKLGRRVKIIQPTFPPLIRQNPGMVEPLRANRFILHVLGVDIPEYLIRSYYINSDNRRILTFKFIFFETGEYTYDPDVINNITGFIIENLDPTGVAVNQINLTVVEPISFEKYGDYSVNELLFNTLEFIVRKTEE